MCDQSKLHQGGDFLPTIERPRFDIPQRVPRAAAKLHTRVCQTNNHGGGPPRGPRMASTRTAPSGCRPRTQAIDITDSILGWCRDLKGRLEALAIPLHAKQSLGVSQDFSPEAVFASLSTLGECVHVVRCRPCVGDREGQEWASDAMAGKTAAVSSKAHCGPVGVGIVKLNEALARGRFAVASSWSAFAKRGAEARASTAGLLATALAPMAVGMGAFAGSTATPGLMVAFCPIDFGLPSSAGLLDPTFMLKELTMEELERGVLVSTFIQGSLGIARVLLGDVFSGTYQLLLATLGFNARHPGPSSNWLKTYVLITFINGTMSGIDLVQNMLLQNYPTVAMALPFSVNAAHMVTLLVPPVSFMGAYCGWQHIKMQRKVAYEAAMAQQAQLIALMQQFPPPPLLAPMQGQLPMHPAQVLQRERAALMQQEEELAEQSQR